MSSSNFSSSDFDLYCAMKLQRKAENARQRGVEFKMTFTMMRNILRAKKCYYTGLPLTRARDGKPIRGSDLTIDRVDNTIGYVPGNVVASSHAANSLKAMVESAGMEGLKVGRHVFDKTIKRIEKAKK